MKKLLTSLLACLSIAATSFAMEIGDAVPEVVGTNQDGETVDIAERCAGGYALVFFFPKAETPGCIKQACSLRDAFASLSERDVSVLGVSADDAAAQKNFHSNRNLPYPLIADSEGKVIQAFGVPQRANGTAQRQAFLFKDGALVWKDETASTEEQAQDVLAVIGEMEEDGDVS